jgi:hypothetical protein
LQDPPKFTQIGIFGLKICHLATLFRTENLTIVAPSNFILLCHPSKSRPGLPDLSWYNLPIWEKCTKLPKNIQMALKYIKWPSNRPNVHKIYQSLPLQGPTKFTQIGIFGLKTFHLATLESAAAASQPERRRAERSGPCHEQGDQGSML